MIEIRAANVLMQLPESISNFELVFERTIGLDKQITSIVTMPLLSLRDMCNTSQCLSLEGFIH